MSDGAGIGGAGAPAGGSATATSGAVVGSDTTPKQTSIREAFEKAKAQQAKKAAPKGDDKPEAKAEPKEAPKASEKPKDGDAPKANPDKGDINETREEQRKAPRGVDEARQDLTEDERQERVQPEKEAKTAHKPPPGWSPEAKEAFASLPPHVQEAVARREAEVDRGFKQYAGIKQFAEAASRNGTSLDRILGRLSQVEEIMQRDPIRAFMEIGNEYGIDFTKVAQAVMQNAQSGPDGQPQQRLPDPEVLALKQQLNALGQQITEGRTSSVRTEVESFAKDPKNEHFDEVAEDVSRILQADIAKYRQMPIREAVADAYERACWLNPDVRHRLIKSQADREVSARLEKQQAVATQARTASKSVTGSPTHGVALSDKPKPKSIRDAVLTARDMHSA